MRDITIRDTEFGRVEISTISLPENLDSDISGTYTATGRILVAAHQPEKQKDWYRVLTMNEDGEELCQIYDGVIPKKPGANGIRWMCFADNRRVLLGDYVLECDPDLDHCEQSSLVEVVFPEEISRIPGLFMRWSEPIIAPDNVHVCFSSLTGGNAFNFLARLEREEHAYCMKDACLISTLGSYAPNPVHPGDYLLKTQRGGEVKQFVRGGRGITLAGGGKSVSESRLQMLDGEEVFCLTDTLGYEETAILSPDEKLAICMSPRFSPHTDMGILGVVPLTGDMPTRSRYLNVLYQYAIAGVRSHREGNIGPALIDVSRSVKEGRDYQGVNLSDPEGKWVYYSPMSWHPDSTKALWNECTRLCEGKVRSRLRRCRLLDANPAQPVASAATPDGDAIPYALPLSTALEPQAMIFPLVVHGQTGTVTNQQLENGAWETRYEHFSEDGKTFYQGTISVKTPENMFQPGDTVIESRISVTGEHTGKADFRLSLHSDAHFQIFPDRTLSADGNPASYGFAEYDGLRREVADIAD